MIRYDILLIVKGRNIMRKRIFVLLLCIVSACGFLAGCKSSPVNIYEAYGEFYQKFYNKHADSSSQTAQIDCGGRILFDAENNPLLAICDITEMSEETGIVSDIYIYEYNNGKVRELAKKTGVASDDNGVFIDSVNGVVTMRVCDHILNNDDDDTVYVLGEDGFKEEASVPVYHDDMVSLEKADMYIDFWYDTYEFADPFYYAFFDNSRYLYTINGSGFNTLLSKLAAINPGTQLELKMVYAEFFKDEDIYEESSFVYVNDKQFYIYDSSDEKLFYLGNFDAEVSEETPEDVPDEIEGIKTELSGHYIKKLLGSVKLNDIKKFECKDNKVYIQTVQGISLEVPSVYNYPDSDDYNKTADWNIYIGEEKTSIESSYDAVKKYIDAGLAEDILIN